MKKKRSFNIISYVYYVAVLFLLSACQSTQRMQSRKSVFPDPKPQQTTVFTTPVMTPTLSSEPKKEATKPVKTQTWEEKKAARLQALLQDSLLQVSQLGLFVVDLDTDVPLFAYNAQQRMRPASCEKVVTAVSALHYLGGDYLLRTKVCTTGEVAADGTLNGDLYVIGGMDPMLSKADVRQMAKALQQAGVKRIGGKMYVDVSMKDSNPLGWGWCWDDKYGPLTALSVDGKDAFTEIWLAALKECKITVPTSARTKAERERIDGVLLMPAISELARAMCPESAKVLAEVTHSIDQLLQKMMKDSDNIYAESLFCQLAANLGVKRAGRKEAVQQINGLIDSLGLLSSDYQIADGSGLSLYNYVSPTLLVSLLKHAYNTPAIISHLMPSLPVSGIDGTLKNRMKAGSPAHGIVYAKTGTVEGLSSLSGYVKADNGHMVCFSVINQGVAKGSLGRAFQDKVCETLATPN